MKWRAPLCVVVALKGAPLLGPRFLHAKNTKQKHEAKNTRQKNTQKRRCKRTKVVSDQKNGCRQRQVNVRQSVR